ncbi:acyl-coenzyme A thioesterase 9, partial [Phenoliferia sp. Uapishka_3]
MLICQLPRALRSVSRASASSPLRTFTSSSLLAREAAIEPENVTRIERVMRLGDQLGRSSKHSVAPLRLRGSGAFSAKPHVVAPKRLEAQLPTKRRMEDSYVSMDLLFSSNAALREQYIGGLAKVRMGRLMEDFDALAGTAAYRHVLPDGTTPADAASYGLYIVTAAVDRMDMLRPLTNSSGEVPDLRLSGHVSYTTESSLEVFLRLSTIPTGEEPAETILLGRFAMACRASTGGKQKIAQLDVVGPEEEELWQMGKEMREGKKSRSQKSLEKTPPNEKEAKLMHDLFVGKAEIFKRNAPTPSDVVWMSDTNVNSALLMHPQERNVHNKVFGGYLMRLAYETAYSTACLFAQTPVTFLALDELRFALPVEIGSLLTLDSRVTFSPIVGEHKSFHVAVEAGSRNLATGEKHVTNTFHFTFSSDKPLARHVLPRSYKQAMQWLDAQRRREQGILVRKDYDT